MSIVLKSKKFDVMVQMYSPATPHLWYAQQHSETMNVDLKKSVLQHQKTESSYVRAILTPQTITREYKIRRAKVLGDWMRAELGSEKKGYNPCPGWIGDVLDAITEYYVIKTIVE